MRQPQRLMVLVVLAGLGLGACGTSTNTSNANGAANDNVLAGKSAHAIVLDAAKDTPGSFRFTVTAKLAADTTGVKNVPPSTLQEFGPLGTGLTMDASGAEESPERLTVTVKLDGAATSIVDVTYDGKAYVSNDGGKTFAVSSATSQGTGIVDASPDGVKQVLTALPSVTDLGATTEDGVAVEHLSAPVGNTLVTHFLTPQTAQIAKLLTVKGGTLDVYVRRDTGQLERVIVHASFLFDLGAAFRSLSAGALSGASAPSGQVAYTLDENSQFTDYGAAVSITKPVVAAGATGSSIAAPG